MFRDGAQRRKALVAAGQLLLGARRYQEGVTLMREGAAGVPNAQLATTLDALSRLEPREQVKLAPGDLRGLLLQLLGGLVDGDAGRMMGAFTSELGSLEGEELQKLARHVDGGALNVLREQRELVLDSAASVVQLEVEGDANAVRRVRMLNPLDATNQPAIFVKLERGQPRIFAVGPLLSPLGGEAIAASEAGAQDTARRLLQWAAEEGASASLEPRERPHVFLRMWPKLKDGGKEELQRAAAALIADGTSGIERGRLQKAITVLRAWEPVAPAEWKELVRLGLAGLAAAVGHRDDALKWTEAALQADPKSRLAFAARLHVLRKLGGDPDLQLRAARARLELLPDDEPALLELVNAAQRRGDLAEAGRLLERLLALDGAEPWRQNNAAWNQLAQGSADDEALRLANRAVAQLRERHPSALNTLAAIHAARGNGAEAVRLLNRSVELGVGLDTDANVLVRGLLAEAYGLRDEAARLYRSISTNRPESAVSSAAIAARRLEQLK